MPETAPILEFEAEAGYDDEEDNDGTEREPHVYQVPSCVCETVRGEKGPVITIVVAEQFVPTLLRAEYLVAMHTNC